MRHYEIADGLRIFLACSRARMSTVRQLEGQGRTGWRAKLLHIDPGHGDNRFIDLLQ